MDVSIKISLWPLREGGTLCVSLCEDVQKTKVSLDSLNSKGMN